MWCSVLLILLVLSILGISIATLVHSMSSTTTLGARESARETEQHNRTTHADQQIRQWLGERLTGIGENLSHLKAAVVEAVTGAPTQLPMTFELNPHTRDRWVASKASVTPAGARVLDVSSGNQPYRSLFAHCDYQSHEFEGNKNLLDDFRGENVKYSNIHTKYDFVGDISNTGAPSNTYDLVILTEVLEHVPEPLLAMKELARVAKPGGRIIVTAPFTSGSHQKPYHFSAGYSREWYVYAAEKFGLQPVDVQSQGDYFKVLAQELNRAMSLPLPSGITLQEATTLREETYNYMARMSQQYGDHSQNKLEIADDFTIGWMVEFVKKI